MSSFVIGKEEYIKAAGLVSGISQIKKIWHYDYNSCRNSTPEDYYNQFVKFYEMNALSVQEQYDDPEPETDSNDYKATFKKAMKAGTAAVINGGLRDRIMQLRSFFKCAMYQTEKESYSYMMQLYFDRLLVELMQYLHKVPENSWGDIEL